MSNARVPAAATGLPAFIPGLYRMRGLKIGAHAIPSRIVFVDRIEDDCRGEDWYGVWLAKPSPGERPILEGELVTLGLVECIYKHRQN
ncbi:hypothetical protein ACQKLX_27785 [Bosea sp. NPDC003192]|uniref:hypothetical protein n=1 Tax=Bosea sp. NPDC003192 TaxID=3390551 RepID=UPI003CFD30A0